MKKLILSMFIVLGTMASIQAQSFDFNCSTLSTEAPGYGQTYVPGDFTQTQADVLFNLGLETSSNDLHFTYPIMIGDASIIVGEGPMGTYEVYDEHGGGDFYGSFDTFEEAIAYISSLLPQGFTIDQALDLVDDGVVYTTIAVNGCASCPSNRRFQGTFVATNGDVQTFILAVSREGATHEVYNDDFTILIDGFAPHNYSITGHNFTTEYFLDLDVAIARAMELNTRN